MTRLYMLPLVISKVLEFELFDIFFLLIYTRFAGHKGYHDQAIYIIYLYPLFCKALLYRFALLAGSFFKDVPFVLRIAGALLPFALFKLIGFGDVLLLSSLGFVFGIYDLLSIFALASICSGIVCAIALLFKKVKKEDSLPFAPYICSACLIYMAREYLPF